MKQREMEQNLAFAGAAVSGAMRMASQPTPEALDNCAAELARARRHLEDLTTAPAPAEAAGRSSVRTGLEQLNRSLVRLRNLLDNAAGYWAGWIQLRDAMAAGYTGQGEAAQVPRPGRLSLEG
ncbi:MAG: hypothetical protein ACE141_00510 [Bryobacteraceae bacterium]